MINLLKDEVLYLRGELAKTRDLLGEIIKTKFEKDEIYEKNQSLIIDSLKFGERRDPNPSYSTVTPSPHNDITTFQHAPSLLNISLSSLLDDIPTDADNEPATCKASGKESGEIPAPTNK